jgi:hypothetical protein
MLLFIRAAMIMTVAVATLVCNKLDSMSILIAWFSTDFSMFGMELDIMREMAKFLACCC